MSEDGRLRYRPSEAVLPPSPAWAVGDTCRVKRTGATEYSIGVVQALDQSSRDGSRPEACVVRFQTNHKGLTADESFLLEELRPLEAANFASQAARGGAVTARHGDEPSAYLTPLERALSAQASSVLRDAMALLDDDVLPFGWEVAYTAAGEKYYIECDPFTTLIA